MTILSGHVVTVQWRRGVRRGGESGARIAAAEDALRSAGIDVVTCLVPMMMPTPPS